MTPPIIIVAGGTGGHVFPALALAETLKKKNDSTHILTDTRTASFWPSRWKNVTILPIQPLRSGFKGKWIFLVSLTQSAWKAFRLFWNLKPIAVVAFGGYPTLPALLVAIILRCPIILHEQNAVVGRVNRLFAWFAKSLAISWPQTQNLPAHAGLEIDRTGLPVREAIGELHKRRYCSLIRGETLRIFILGGSQGSQVFDTLIPEALGLLPEAQQQCIEIIHQCRQEMISTVKEAYQSTKVKVTLQPFFNDIPEILAKVNLVISRSGASTLGELTTAGVPAILVPYKDAKDDHQTVNAQNLVRLGAAWAIPQHKFTRNKLKKIFEAVLQRPEILLASSEALNPLKSHKASQKLANIVYKVNLEQFRKSKRNKNL